MDCTNNVENLEVQRLISHTNQSHSQQINIPLLLMFTNVVFQIWQQTYCVHCTICLPYPKAQ